MHIAAAALSNDMGNLKLCCIAAGFNTTPCVSSRTFFAHGLSIKFHSSMWPDK